MADMKPQVKQGISTHQLRYAFPPRTVGTRNQLRADIDVIVAEIEAGAR